MKGRKVTFPHLRTGVGVARTSLKTGFPGRSPVALACPLPLWSYRPSTLRRKDKEKRKEAPSLDEEVKATWLKEERNCDPSLKIVIR